MVGQAHASREQLAREIGLSLLLPAALALPLMALVVWWVVGRTLRPVDEVARQVGALDAQALAPLDEAASLPDEIAPLRSALNALVRRVNEAFDHERRFTADAAHELRTPLAALKVQAQVALRCADGRQPATRTDAGDGGRRPHDASGRAIADAGARRPGQPGPPAAAAGSRRIIAVVCAESLPQAQRKGNPWTVDMPPDCRLAVSDPGCRSPCATWSTMPCAMRAKAHISR